MSEKKDNDTIEITICDGCDSLRDNKLGLYCRLGTRKLKKVKKKGKQIIVSLDCDQLYKEKITIKRRK